jgi:hypothetical protein
MASNKNDQKVSPPAASERQRRTITFAEVWVTYEEPDDVEYVALDTAKPLEDRDDLDDRIRAYITGPIR